MQSNKKRRWVWPTVAVLIVLGVAVPLLKKAVTAEPADQPVSGAVAEDGRAVDANGYKEPNEGYVVHDHAYYVKSQRVVKPDELGEELGKITRIGDWTLKKEGDTNWFTPQKSVMYAIKGTDPQKEFVVKTEVRQGKDGATSMEYQAVKYDSPVIVDTTHIFASKNDPEEVGYALQNTERVDKDFYRLTGMEQRAKLTFMVYDQARHTAKMQYNAPEFTGDDQGMHVPGWVEVYEYPASDKGNEPSSIFGESSKNQGLAPMGQDVEVNGLHFQHYAKNLFLAQKGDYYYEVHFLGAELLEKDMVEYLGHFEPGKK